MKFLNSKYSYTVLVFLFSLFISIPIISPYFNQGYFPTHDGEWAVVRLADMFRTIRDMQIPARYSGALNFGYGYPLFNFAYPFPYYLGVFVYFLTGSFTTAVKLIFALSVPLSSFFIFLASAKLWKSRIAGIVSATVYIYVPYRMVDLFVRGSIGESIAFVLFALIFYLAIRISEKYSRALFICLSISIAMLVTTHNIMTVLFIPFATIFVIAKAVAEKKYESIKIFLQALLLGAGISCFFWMPALLEKGNVLLSKIPIADRNIYFVNINQLIFPNWGFGPPTEPNGFSYQIGIAQILFILVIFSIIMISFKGKKVLGSPSIKIAAIIIALISVSILMMFSFTSFVWETTPLLSEINYPWIMLSQIAILTGLLSGFLATQGTILKYLAIAMSLMVVFLTVAYANPETYVNRGDDFYLTNEATTTSSDELMPLWVREKPLKHFEEKVDIVKGEAFLSDLKFNSKQLSFLITSNTESSVRINTIYYPGWKAYIDSKMTNINYKNKFGVMDVEIPRGEHEITLKFGETFPRMIADTISVISLLIVIIILLKSVFIPKV